MVSRAEGGQFGPTANRLTKKKLPVFPTLGLKRIGGRHMKYDTDYSTNFSAHFRDYIRRIEHHDHIHYEEARALAGKGHEIPFEPLDVKERRLWPVRRNTFLAVMSEGSEAQPESTRKLPKALSQVM